MSPAGSARSTCPAREAGRPPFEPCAAPGGETSDGLGTTRSAVTRAAPAFCIGSLSYRKRLPDPTPSPMILRSLRQRAVVWGTLHLSPRHRMRMRHRARLAARYLSGDGLEIGALHMRTKLPPGARVRFVDYKDLPALLRIYGQQVGWVNLAPVDIVDDGQTLATVPDASVDFVTTSWSTAPPPSGRSRHGCG